MLTLMNEELISLRFWLGMKPEEQAVAFICLYLLDKKLASKDEIMSYCLHSFKPEGKPILFDLAKQYLNEKEAIKLNAKGIKYAQGLKLRYNSYRISLRVQHSVVE